MARSEDMIAELVPLLLVENQLIDDEDGFDVPIEIIAHAETRREADFGLNGRLPSRHYQDFGGQQVHVRAPSQWVVTTCGKARIQTAGSWFSATCHPKSPPTAF